MIGSPPYHRYVIVESRRGHVYRLDAATPELVAAWLLELVRSGALGLPLSLREQ